MKSVIRHLRAVTLSLGLCGLLLPVIADAVVSSDTLAQFTSYPVISTTSATPLVMLDASNDNQLYFKAYNEYTDLDGDGVPETTYKHSVDYFGYFDKGLCYTYSSANARFEPSATTSDKYCNGSTWSGNFLNWATMTRMDEVRRILFGGRRSTDTGSDTVLERVYLPNDAHSFAKYYNGSDINKLTPFSPPTTNTGANQIKNGITICNTTVNNSNAVSQNVTDPPLMRVAQGNYSLWAVNERWQCRWSGEKSPSNSNDPATSGIYAYSSNPTKGTNSLSYGGVDGDFIVRVKVCVSGYLESNCSKYPSANYKPTGLLQKYGEKGQIYFGLMSGTYNKNKSGSALVKNVSTMSDEINVATNGTFTSTRGIINAWNTYRIVNYNHSDGTYGVSGQDANNCIWGKNYFTDGTCQNWGNPFGEIYLNAIRYFAGKPGNNPAFVANDTTLLSGLAAEPTWTDPLSQTNFCAPLNTVNFNGSVISYDDNQLNDGTYGVPSIWSSTTSASWTDLIGAGEGINGNNYFIGTNGTNNNQLCTGKTVGSLGSVTGLCPEAPRLSGTYNTSGIAYAAHVQSIRNDLNDTTVSATTKAKITVDTYAVALATSLPRISIPVPGNVGKKIQILPACRNLDASGDPVVTGGNCALVDFQIVSQDINAGTGKFLINWEDSEQGGDYDQDMWGILSYSISNGTLTVTTNAVGQSTGYKMGFGYVISGTDKDGFHAHSGINGYNNTDPTTVPGCNNCLVVDAATNATYSVGTSTATFLQDPLFYAAKWGGFDDENPNASLPTPDRVTEWDRKNTDGVATPDGIPDNYFYVTRPDELDKSLNKVFSDIIAKTGSGTAASVVASSRQGQGSAYQALYVTRYTDDDGRTVNWFGDLYGLFIDSQGNLREDGNGNKILDDDYTVDPVVEIVFDTTSKQTKIQRHTSSTTSTYTDSGSTLLPLSDLKSLWNARKQLSAVSGDLKTQRTYTDLANTGRHILTSFDGTTTTAFQQDSVTSTNFGYFNVTDLATAKSVVNYIRGEENTSYRNRTVDYDHNGTAEVLRLGDIVDSTPTVVAAPQENFDQLYSDTTYATFRAQYVNRRQVLYVGANDGMLHAFNGGFYDPATREFKFNDGTHTAHPLGSELWAYVPMNLLPHLKWLTDPNYTHVYYVDGKPRVFDAKIFTADATHPGGWGTVLVVGMRLGGGTVTVDTQGNGLGGANAADDKTLSSAYTMLDITDPEQTPKLLGELTNAGLGYTTSYPTAMAIADKSGTPNNWYLTFGTGPTDLATVTSTQTSKLLVYDLIAKNYVTNFGFTGTVNNLDATSFAGDPVSADWNLSYKADAVYIGTAGGTAAAPTGNLYKLAVNKSAVSTTWVKSVLLTTGKAITETPTLSVDTKGNHWVYAGTGRFYVNGDKSSSAQQTLYGVKDPTTGSGVSLPATTGLVDVSSAVVKTDGTMTGVTGATTVTALDTLIDTKDGWMRNLASGTPSARNTTTSALLGEVLLTAVYTPDSGLCGQEGSSVLYGLNYRTGVPSYPTSPFGADTSGVLVSSVSLQSGAAASPSLHVIYGSDGRATGIKVFTQSSTGAIKEQGASTATPIGSGEISWRELLK